MTTVVLTYPPGKEVSPELMKKQIAFKMNLDLSDITDLEISKRSIDARGGKVLIRYTVSVCFKGESFSAPYKPDYKFVDAKSQSVVIIGSGPSGLFAALTLLRHGIKPIILERGSDVHKRKVDIAKLYRESIVNPDSNYCFGEGGAGTFSDGKLFTRSTKRGDVKEVLSQFIFFGADKSITYDSHPHIGSDKLPAIIEKMRNTIIEHGGEVHFGIRVLDLETADGMWSVICDNATFKAKNVILAAGHSAKEFYELFYKKLWPIEAKGFAVGVRVEHPQRLIDKMRYHTKYANMLPAAEYSLVTQVGGRGVFSFCMCPGGLLVPSMTSSNEMVLNGMSNSHRNSPFANSGVVVQVMPEDIKGFDSYGPLKLLKFQEKLEHAMYVASGSSLKAPAQRMRDFVERKLSDSLPDTSYSIGVISAPLHSLLPSVISNKLARAFKAFDMKMRGYYTNEALLLGIESRTSSPVRILRDQETMQCVNLPGLYPVGEGSGYAGGIVSSAIDGINCANAIYKKTESAQ